MFSVGHLSDLHATPVVIRNPIHLLNKRFFGWLSWRLRRRKIYQPQVLEALISDLAEVRPHHVIVTGDLTNIALQPEFLAARHWLERLGSGRDVSVIPGNHDAYVKVPQQSSWELWSDYMASDKPNGDADISDPRRCFPALRIRGPLALVGVCSAVPMPLFKAGGTVGAAQLERLEAMLSDLSDSQLCRVVSIHHPITEGATDQRRALTDAEALRGVLRRAGAELVVHGHNHRTQRAAVEGPSGPIPVIGVRSATHMDDRPHRRAQYHIYDFERATDPSGPRFDISFRAREYDPRTGQFSAHGERAPINAC